MPPGNLTALAGQHGVHALLGGTPTSSRQLCSPEQAFRTSTVPAMSITHRRSNSTSFVTRKLHACRWKLGAQDACLIVEDPGRGLLGAWSCQEGVQKLRAALDQRGERELGLLNELAKVCL